jgi:hypothetical protein
MPSWSSATWALCFYRTDKQLEFADSLEKKIEAQFATASYIADWKNFRERHLEPFESESNPRGVTLQTYALLLHEQEDPNWPERIRKRPNRTRNEDKESSVNLRR